MRVAIDRKVKKLSDNAEAASEQLAHALVNDVRAHWSRSSPSSPGRPPASDPPTATTGNLDKSGRVERRGEGGRFVGAGGNATYSVRWNAIEGGQNNKRGDYAPALEFGNEDTNLLPRPFLRPAIKRLRPVAIDLFKRKLF